ncbi:hypothetical protein [Pectobacterium odoriferum]|uniref:hypothetical protein n=1 Tax=Pectobacterium odoriferum TaxID=78398 RepID=UPI000CD036F6|nr:hypothetical protein [Pectobacterium odoriferum]POD90086.1 hypothetical protein BV925_18590 [Pectobacterium odoriferum]
MILELIIIDEWPLEAKKKGRFNHINYFNDSKTPKKNRLFVLKNNHVYEHTILCPILEDLPENSLLKINTINENKFIIDTDCEWPIGITPDEGFIPKPSFNSVDFGYLYMINDIDVIPSHIEFNALREYSDYHLSKTETFPLIKIKKFLKYSSSNKLL